MNTTIVRLAAALLVCLAAAVAASAQPVTDGTVAVDEYTWSGGDWRMAHDATYLYVAKVSAGSAGMVVHLDTDPRSTPTAGSSANGNLDSASMLYGAATMPVVVKLPFRGDAEIIAGAETTRLQVRDGSGGWTTIDSSNVTVGTSSGVIEMKVRWDAIPGLTGRPSAFNWAGNQVQEVGLIPSTSNLTPSQNTPNGTRLEYFYNVASTSSNPFGDTRSTWLVTTNGDSGTYSLRSAVDSANSDAISSRRYITFDLGGAATINLITAMAAITRTVTIDGTAYAGYTNQPIVTLDGPGPLQNVDALSFNNSSSSDVRGLALRDFTRGILVSGGSNNTIAANWIGVTTSCTTGIQAFSTTNLTIGGTTSADTNIIVNNGSGVVLDSTTDAQILNNRIGIDSGDAAAANFNGIELISTTNTVIGGAGTGNTISSNTNDGIHADNTAQATILGNRIGVASDGTTARGNGGDGIDGTANLTVGSLLAPNTIANNSAAAVRATVGNLLIRYNSIYGNGSNIVLTGGQPVPTVSRASVGDGTTLGIEFSLASNNTTATAQSFQLDLYLDNGGPRTLLATSQCFDQTLINGFQWTVGTGYSASSNYFLVATSYEDHACSNPADGSSQALSVDPTTGSASTVNLQSSTTSAWSGGTITLTAIVTATPTPTGTVTFREDGNPIGNCTNLSLTGGQAQCAVPTSSDGSRAYTAVYNGDAFNASGTSNTVNVTVQTHVFTGTGNFFDATKWTSNTLPLAGENLRIDGTCTFNTGTAYQYGAMEISQNATVLWTSNHNTALRVTQVSGSGSVDMTGGGTLESNTWSGVTLTRGIGTIKLTAGPLPALDFYNLTVGGDITSSAGAATIYGTLSVLSGATFTPSQLVTARGTISNAGTLTFSTLTVPSAATVTATSSFNAGAFTIDGTFIPNATTVVSGTSLTGSGTVYVLSVTTPNSFASQYTMGSKTLTNLTVYFNGAAAQSVDALQYGSLTIDNASGATTAGQIQISGGLYLKTGVLTASGPSFRVQNSSTSAITWLNGWIVGNGFYRRVAAGTGTYTFPVGLAAYPAFLTVTFHDEPSPVDVDVSAWGADVADLASNSGLDLTRDANVYWRFTDSAAPTWDFSASFAGLPDPGATPTAFAFRMQQQGMWADHAANAAASGISASGITRGGSAVAWIATGNQLARTNTSQITAASSQIVNNGTSTTTITVQLRDVLNVPLKMGGHTVTLSTTLGTLSAVTDNNNGTYTATLTAGNTAGTATITGTLNGSAITDNATVVFDSIATPTGLSAAATSATSVGLTWNAVGGATSYAIFRSSSGTNSFTQVGTSGTAAFTDPTASANTAYLYRVRAFSGQSVSSDSAFDLATTVIFTDPTLTGATVKAVHFSELRTAVNAVRALAGQGSFTFTSPTPANGGTILKVHVEDLRTALTAARSALGLSSNFTDPTLTTSTVVKAVHLTELRSGVQ